MSRAWVRAAALATTAAFAPSCGDASSRPLAASDGEDGSALTDGVAGDASDDGGSAGESIDWCVAQGSGHLLCEDFDQGTPGKFASKTYGGGTVAGDVTEYVSPPESMWASTPALAGARSAAGALATMSLATSGTHFRFQAELQIDASCVANNDGATLVTLGLGPYSLALVAGSSGSSLMELRVGADGGLALSAEHPLSSTLPTDSWRNVVIDSDLAARVVTVTIADKSVLSDSLLYATADAQPDMAGPMSIAVGPAIENQAAQSAGCRVRVDNVLVDSM
jgi:hypothetical protein